MIMMVIEIVAISVLIRGALGASKSQKGFDISIIGIEGA